MPNKIRFYLINLLFPSNSEKMEFVIGGISLLYRKVADYAKVEKLLEKSHGVANTCYVDIPILDTIDKTVAFLSKVNFLLSFCRGNIINYSSYLVLDRNGVEIKNGSQNPISTPYTILELIPRDFIRDTQDFLSNAFEVYEEIDSLYMVRKIAREYSTTRNSATFITSRSLIITAIVENILYLFNKNIDNLELLDAEKYIKAFEDIKNISTQMLNERFDKKNKARISLIIRKMDGLNQITLDWKFQKFIKHYHIPISEDEIKTFKYYRDSLAHTLNFPENEDNVQCWKFLSSVIDRIILGLFGYQGVYYNFYSDTDEFYKLKRS